MSSTFKILFVVRTNKIPKNGLVTISVRITIEGDSLEFSSKIAIDPTLWDAGSGKLTGRTKMAVEANTALEKINARLRSKYSQVEEQLGYVTPELLKNAFFGTREKETTLLLLTDKKIVQKRALAGASIQASAIEKYKGTKSRLEEFIASYSKTKDIGIKQVDYDFIMGFDTFLRSKYHCGHNTTVKYLRYLKQITTEALKSGLIQIDPFMNITLSSKKGYREYLSEEELKQIINMNFITEILKETRDVFVFCSYTGFAYIDASKLTIDDIVTKNGKQYIVKSRTKTGVQAFVPLLKTPQKIIAKYQKKNLSTHNLLPIHACQVTNRYLKEIASLCGIKKSLSTHCARHTFATLMLTRGVSIESVSKMLGHTDIKTTQIYARILNEKVITEVSLIEEEYDSMAESWKE